MSLSKRGTILIVDDNRSILSALNILLRANFENVLTLSSPKQLITTLKLKEVDVVLLDMNFGSGINSGNEGLYWLSEIKKNHPKGLEVVLITAYADIELAIEGMKLGACDFIVKPWNNNKLLISINNAYQIAKASKKGETIGLKKPHENIGDREMYWGSSKEMQRIKSLVEKVAYTDANILITGENGTGKEVLAREIHRLSNRSTLEMASVDMGSITETLFESELFGHAKGAFTDAKNDRAGKFETANNSTIFLDEIGNIPLHLQSKLLTVLQTRRVVRVGSNTPIDINIRLISATNQDIDKMVEKSEFRMDLVYRINTITINLTPLRERKEDIIPLAMMFLKTYTTKYDKTIENISSKAEELLIGHYWTGNIRELQHSVEKAVILCSSDTLTERDFSLTRTMNIDKSIEDDATLEDMERKMIHNAIDKHSSNLTIVANTLGISRQTLYNKIKKYNL